MAQSASVRMEAGRDVVPLARITFGIHLVVAAVLGVLLLLASPTVASWTGYPDPGPYVVPMRAFGAALLGLGGVTSLYGLLAKRWEQVDYIVRAEIVYLALQTIVYVVAAIIGVGPAVSNWLFGAVSLILLALFTATFITERR